MNISPGLVKACGELNWNHELETHRIPEQNYTTSERRHFVTGSFSLDFKKAGWAATVEFHYYLRNVQDLPADGQTPNERFNSPLSGPIIPFEVEVKCYRNNIQKKKNQGRVHQFGTKFLPEKFIGYDLNAVRSSTGDLFDNGYGRFANTSTI